MNINPKKRHLFYPSQTRNHYRMMFCQFRCDVNLNHGGRGERCEASGLGKQLIFGVVQFVHLLFAFLASQKTSGFGARFRAKPSLIYVFDVCIPWKSPDGFLDTRSRNHGFQQPRFSWNQNFLMHACFKFSWILSLLVIKTSGIYESEILEPRLCFAWYSQTSQRTK